MTTPVRKSGRSGLIAKIHIARKTLALNEECYRAVLHGATGKDSCADMNEKELEACLQAFRNIGFKPKKTTPKRAGHRKMADSAQASKIRALWLDLYHLGQIEDPSEDALAAFAKRMGKVEALQWMDGYQADKIIKALRGWMERIGYVFPREDFVNMLWNNRMRFGAGGSLVNYYGLANKIYMIHNQCRILNVEPLDFLEKYGFGRYGWLGMIEPETADQAIEKLGHLIRKNKRAHV